MAIGKCDRKKNLRLPLDTTYLLFVVIDKFVFVFSSHDEMLFILRKSRGWLLIVADDVSCCCNEEMLE